MTDEIRDRLRKVYELVNRGATEGEKRAAKAAMDRLVKKYNLNPDELGDIDKKLYGWKWAWTLDRKLMSAILRFFVEDKSVTGTFSSWGKKEMKIKLSYIDWVTVDCAYEYFRRHMKSEWMRVCDPVVKRCRKAKTRKAKREELEPLFFEQYIIKSNLIERSKVKSVDLSEMSEKEIERLGIAFSIKGGQYNRQVVTGHQLPAGPLPPAGTSPKKREEIKGGQYSLF